MNLTQKQSILNSIESILSFDFDKLIVDNNPSGNVDDIKFGEYSVTEFKNNYLKVFSQLKSELESGLGLMLPNQENFQNEFSAVTLDAETINFFTYIQTFANRNSAADILKRFIYYQIRQGFWNKSVVKNHDVDVDKLKQAQGNLALAEKVLSENTKKFKELEANISRTIQEFEEIVKEKNIQSVEITTQLANAQQNNALIDRLLASSTINNTEIVGLSAIIKSKLEGIAADIIVYKEDFDKIKFSNKELDEELKKNLEDALKNIQASKEGNEFIENQREQIIKLIGMAADGSLGYKFNSRKEELQKGMNNFWRWAVPLSIAGALVWVCVVFTVLSAHVESQWANLIINLIKTSPAWVLVGFIFSQYTKERNLQEEYAFKSAIAMTITSYSQMLSDNDSTASKSSKQEMLLKAIENLYLQPVLKIEKGDKPDLGNSKQLVDSLKSISEIVKSVKA
jgi:hypothetical protein